MGSATGAAVPMQAEVAAAVVPAIVAAQTEIQDDMPASAEQKPSLADMCDSLTADFIVRWEITSPQVYSRKYQGVIWPGGGSGPTWGVGYDGGQVTMRDIRSDWNAHPQVERLETTAGIAGDYAQARVRAGDWRGVTTPFPLARIVFTASTLPSYTSAARRALGKGYDGLPCGSRIALRSLGYNRGWQMSGDRRREMRVIRDTCVPNQDAACIAAQLQSMKRLWPDVPGLQARRSDEARIALH